MPWNLKKFIALFLFASAILILGYCIILYSNSIIDGLRIQLQQSGLTSAQRATIQATLNSWEFDKITLLNPFSYIIMSIGSITMLFSVIYSALAIYQQKVETLKHEISVKTPMSKEPITVLAKEQKIKVVPDSASNLLMKDTQGSISKIKLASERASKKPILTNQSNEFETSDEKILLQGKFTGLFDKPQLILTSKRLIIGDRSINLKEITEVYVDQKRLHSELVIDLTNGRTEKLDISPEKSISALTLLSGSLDAQESEIRACSKATADRWVNAINQQLIKN